MTYRRWTVRPDGLIDLLNNARLLGPFPAAGLPLGAKTLVLSEPSATVTFPGEEGAVVGYGDFIAALRAQVPDLHIDARKAVSSASGAPREQTRFLSIYRDGGLRIGKDGTANELLGFSADDETYVRPPVPVEHVKMVARVGPEEYEVVASGPDAEWDDPAPLTPKGR